MTGTLRVWPVRRPARVKVATPRAFSLMASGLASRRVKAGGLTYAMVISLPEPGTSRAADHLEPAVAPHVNGALACPAPPRAEGPADQRPQTAPGRVRSAPGGAPGSSLADHGPGPRHPRDPDNRPVQGG